MVKFDFIKMQQTSSLRECEKKSVKMIPSMIEYK